MNRGMEIAGTVLVFLGIGWVIDRWLSTTPVFMIGLVVLAVVAQFLKLYYVYNAEMSDLEAKRRDAVRAR